MLINHLYYMEYCCRLFTAYKTLKLQLIDALQNEQNFADFIENMFDRRNLAQCSKFLGETFTFFPPRKFI